MVAVHRTGGVRLPTGVEGFCATGFETLVTVFAGAVPVGGAGGAFSAVVDGRLVVDLWAGTVDDAGRPWRADTPAVVFSGSKGVVASAVLVLVERGVLDLEAPVAAIWPEFAAHGKGGVRVGDVLAHTAGLPGVVEPVAVADLADPASIAARLARQAPITDLGVPSYHALTYGWLVDEIVRRSTGLPVARVIADALAGPLDLDLWLGTPPEVIPRVARLRSSRDYAPTALDPAGGEPDPRLRLVYGNPSVAAIDWSDPAILRSQVPAAGVVATAAALARLYGALAAGGEIDGVRILEPATVDLGRAERSRGADPLSGRVLRFGAGFELAGTPSFLGPAPDAFGHTGAGGSAHGAWPGLRTGFSFVTALMRREAADHRASDLLDALYGCLT